MLKILHKFISAKIDGNDNTLVKPDDWNDRHKLETDGAGGVVLGRDTTGPGELQELPWAFDNAAARWIARTFGSLRLPSGTTAQRPVVLDGAELRFNTDTNQLEACVGGVWSALQVGSVPPAGSILPYGGGGIPVGYLLCNGARLSRATFPSLFAAIGLAWDTINDGATFALPNLTGRTLVMADYAGSVLGFAMGIGGYFGAYATAVYVAPTNLANHAHGLLSGPTTAMNNAGIGGFGGGASLWSRGYDTYQTDAQGGGNPLSINALQPGGAAYYMIKT